MISECIVQLALFGCRLVGAFLTTSPDFCFVLEDEETGRVCGYAVAACDARDFNRKFEMAWLPAMQEKYPKPTTGECQHLSPAQVRQISLHSLTTQIVSQL